MQYSSCSQSNLTPLSYTSPAMHFRYQNNCDLYHHRRSYIFSINITFIVPKTDMQAVFGSVLGETYPSGSRARSEISKQKYEKYWDDKFLIRYCFY